MHATIREILLEDNLRKAWIHCEPRAVPAPGRYLLAWALGEPEAPLGTPLFAEQISERGFLAAPPVPNHWEPGDRLSIYGPLGHGFALPGTTRRLAVAALGETISRLLPVIHQALALDASIALFTDQAIPSLPLALEISPLSALPEALTWADFLTLELPLESVPDLRQTLGLAPEARRLPCLAQALVTSAMPCAGMAECGACATPSRRGWKLACKDGPVFALEDLL